jgi:hypothetical protein
MKKRTRKFIQAALAGLIITALTSILWVWRFGRYTPVEVAQDVRAGIKAQHHPHPVERFLELRYGPLTEPTNRQNAFLDFFNVGHIEGLQLLTRRMEAGQRATNVAGMAQWLADYRSTMTPEEKRALSVFLRSESGRLALRRATAQYLSQDVRYRAVTAPVIQELMTAVAEIQKP